MKNPIIYLAGPEVFYPDATEQAQRSKLLCMHNCATGISPIDNQVDTSLPKEEQARMIVKGNMKMIQQADMVFANLSNFRGSSEHPYCDSGTAWECGYAVGLGKKVIAYTTNQNSIPKEIINAIHLVVKTSCSDTKLTCVFNTLNQIVLRDFACSPTHDIGTLLMDPPFADIQDVNSSNAFFAGLNCAQGKLCKVSLSDKRPQIEKFGATDKNGNRVEDFGMSMNIMIALNSEYTDF